MVLLEYLWPRTLSSMACCLDAPSGPYEVVAASSGPPMVLPLRDEFVRLTPPSSMSSDMVYQHFVSLGGPSSTTKSTALISILLSKSGEARYTRNQDCGLGEEMTSEAATTAV